MKCGELGFLNADGTPCRQNIAATATSCLWHDQSPRGRRKADLERKRGGIASRAKLALPASYLVKPFDSVDSIIEWAHEMAGKVLKEDVDPRRTSEARGFAQLAVSAHQIRTQERMVEALLRLEHGGTAIVLLERMQASLSSGIRRPLPGRVMSLPNEESSA
jgi:hypothetical protein